MLLIKWMTHDVVGVGYAKAAAASTTTLDEDARFDDKLSEM